THLEYCTLAPMVVSHEGKGKKRDSLVDLARIIAIIAIIISHCTIRTPFHGGSVELAWATVLIGFIENPVCFFFFFAGYFAKKTSSPIVWERPLQLLVSTCLWALIGFVVFHCLNSWMHYIETGQALPWDSLSLYQVVGDFSSAGIPGHMDLWFMKVLIPIVLVSGLLVRLPAWSLIVVVAGCFGVAYGVDEETLQALPYFLQEKFLLGIAYFSSGVLARRYITLQTLSGVMSKIGVGYFAVMFIQSAVSPYVHWNAFEIPVLGGFLEILYFLSMAQVVKRYVPCHERLARYGVAVFFVYVTQEFFVIGAKVLFTAYPINMHLYTFVPFAILLLCLLLYEVAQRVLPTRIRKIVCLQS
ncbi:MAG: hypothetical protein Q4C88_04795, partial [Akkermansia sp.]|nr:hypothetical protein [Akkermansia sp.]